MSSGHEILHLSEDVLLLHTTVIIVGRRIIGKTQFLRNGMFLIASMMNEVR